MTRLARGRATHLTRDEIAAAALRRFDAGGEVSIRELAAVLGVAPSAIYHHYPSRTAIVDDALDLVWREAYEEGAQLIEADGSGDPAEFLLLAALATRRAFARHHALGAYLAATPAMNEKLAESLGPLAIAFEALGLSGREAAEAFHAYASFAVGATMVLTARLNFARGAGERGEDGTGSGRGDAAGLDRAEDGEAEATRREMAAMMDVSRTDPDRDEELFLDGLRRLLASFTAG